MLNDLSKIIDKLEIPKTDPSAMKLKRQGLASYKNDEITKLKTEIRQSEASRETQLFLAISYLFEACTNFHDGEIEKAIAAASNAIEIFRVNTGGAFNEALGYWFRGTLHLIEENQNSAIIDFNEAIKILVSCINALSGDEDEKRTYYKKIIHQIAGWNGITLETFSWIIDRLGRPENDSQRIDLWNTILKTDTPDLSYVNSLIAALESILDPRRDDAPYATPFDIILLAHCYNLGYYAGELQYQERAFDTAINRFAVSDMVDYNLSLLHWYRALLCYNSSDPETGLLYLNNAEHLMEKLLYEYRDTRFYEELKKLRGELKYFVSELSPKVRISRDAVLQKRESMGTLWDRVSLWKDISSRHSRATSRSTVYSPPPISRSIPEQTLPITHEVDTILTSLQPQNTPKERSSPHRQRQPMHITIPVDTQVLEELSQETVPLDARLYNLLQEYNAQKANRQSPRVKVTPRNTRTATNPPNS
jgi:tetratricopeptide (TPR) repeat protein